MEIEECENLISRIIAKPEVSKRDWNLVSASLGRILTNVFTKQGKETGLRSWSVDDMHADKVEVCDEKITLRGVIHWLGGGSNCVYYQVDLSRDTKPMLYSYKLKNKHWKQVMYVGKTFNGWIVNKG